MEAIEYEEKRSFGMFFRIVVKGFFQQIFVLISKGIGFGIVLFLALSTLSLLNRGMDYLQRSEKSNSLGSVRQAQMHQAPALVSQYRVNSQGYSSGANTRSGSTKNTRDTIRESGYFVSSVESFVRALSRFSK